MKRRNFFKSLMAPGFVGFVPPENFKFNKNKHVWHYPDKLSKFVKAKDVEVGMILKTRDLPPCRVTDKVYEIGVYFISIQPIIDKPPHPKFGIPTLTMPESNFNGQKFEIIGTLYKE